MNLFLIGYRGSGKSTVAPLIAAQLEREIVDTDLLVEAAAQKTIAEIFSQHGEPHFRALETEAILAIEQSSNLIVSLGGGAPLAQANRDWIRKTGKTVWLTADPNVLWKRISDDEMSATRRPDLTDEGGLAEVKQVLKSRFSVYDECADFTIDVGPLSPQQIAEQIVLWWESVDKEDV